MEKKYRSTNIKSFELENKKLNTKTSYLRKVIEYFLKEKDKEEVFIINKDLFITWTLIKGI